MSLGKRTLSAPSRLLVSYAINAAISAESGVTAQQAKDRTPEGVRGPVVVRSNDARVTSIQWALVLRDVAGTREGRTREFWEAFSATIQHAHHFDFGNVEAERFRSEGRRAATLMEQGHLSIPFSSVVFWYNVEVEGYTHRVATLVTRVKDVKHDWFLIADFYKSDAQTHTMLDPDHQFKHSYVLEAAGWFKADPDEKKWMGIMMDTMVDLENRPALEQQAASLADGVSVLSLILNTKGVPRRVEEPTAKLQQIRQQGGKLPLPTVTHIDVRYYRKADKNSQGTHASPVPHLRRGHIRRLHDREIWINDTLVNCVSLAHTDRSYDVKHD